MISKEIYTAANNNKTTGKCCNPSAFIAQVTMMLLI
jgi:hypothetical protein